MQRNNHSTTQKAKTLRNHSIDRESNIVFIHEAFKVFLLVKDLEGLRKRTLDDHIVHSRYFYEWLSVTQEDVKYVNQITPNICRSYVSFMKNEKHKWDNHPTHSKIEPESKPGLSPVTINIRIRSLKAQFNFYVKEGYIDSNPWDTISLLKTDKDKLDVFSKEDLIKLLRAPDRSSFTGLRDYILMLTLLDTGCRISELLALNEWDIDYEKGIMFIGAEHSKPRSGRIVPFSDKTKKFILQLLDQNHILEDAEPALFITVTGKRLTSADARRIFRKYGQQVELKNVRVSPHTMRHTFATKFILNGGDPFTLQEILGHSNMDTTKIYVCTKVEEIKKQHEKFSPIT